MRLFSGAKLKFQNRIIGSENKWKIKGHYSVFYHFFTIVIVVTFYYRFTFLTYTINGKTNDKVHVIQSCNNAYQDMLQVLK